MGEQAVGVAADGVLPSSEAEGASEDFGAPVAVGSGRYAEREKGSRRFVEVVGSPDLVVEVVSEHSVRKDTELLRERYFEAGRTGLVEFSAYEAAGFAGRTLRSTTRLPR